MTIRSRTASMIRSAGVLGLGAAFFISLALPSPSFAEEDDHSHVGTPSYSSTVVPVDTQARTQRRTSRPVSKLANDPSKIVKQGTIFVKTIEDFRDHINAHIERVSELAVEVAKRNPNYFKDLDLSVLRRFAQLHDAEKLDAEITPALFKMYGEEIRKPDGTVDPDKMLSDKVIKKMNRLGDSNAFKFFAALHNPRMPTQNFFEYEDGTPVLNPNVKIGTKKIRYTETAIKYMVAVMIGDKVDRGFDPVALEEWRRTSMESGSAFLRKLANNPHMASTLLDHDLQGVIKDPRIVKMALDLESVYKLVVYLHTFVEFQARKHRAMELSCLSQETNALLSKSFSVQHWPTHKAADTGDIIKPGTARFMYDKH